MIGGGLYRVGKRGDSGGKRGDDGKSGEGNKNGEGGKSDDNGGVGGVKTRSGKGDNVTGEGNGFNTERGDCIVELSGAVLNVRSGMGLGGDGVTLPSNVRNSCRMDSTDGARGYGVSAGKGGGGPFERRL